MGAAVVLKTMKAFIGVILLVSKVSANANISAAEVLKKSETEKLLATLFEGLQSPHTFQEDRDGYPGQPVTYGEILAASVADVSHQFDHVQRHEKEFWDLGSGAGKLVLQEFLENGWKRSVGVELVKRRWDIAHQALAKLSEMHAEQNPSVLQAFGEDAKLTLTGDEQEEYGQEVCFGTTERGVCMKHDDMTKVDGMENAGGVFMCSTCFSDELLSTVMDKQFTKMSPQSVVLSLRKLPERSLAKDGLELEATLDEDMSWAKADHVRVYKRLDDHSVKEEGMHVYTL